VGEETDDKGGFPEELSLQDEASLIQAGMGC